MFIRGLSTIMAMGEGEKGGCEISGGAQHFWSFTKTFWNIPPLICFPVLWHARGGGANLLLCDGRVGAVWGGAVNFVTIMEHLPPPLPRAVIVDNSLNIGNVH